MIGLETTIDIVNTEHFDDPVAAYDRLAAHYTDLTRRRESYLRSVEREIISRIPAPSWSLLDVGAGDGTRALRIASQSGIERMVLVEPSREMASKSLEPAEVWPVRAENLTPGCAENVGTAEGGCPCMITERFDVITCLWNVLGHIPTAEKRQHALSTIARLLSPSGRFFLDVNHRYNLRSYGVLPTSRRWIHDRFVTNQKNGDVTAHWSFSDVNVSTYGHVFTHREVMGLADAVGLNLEGRLVIDYSDGRACRFSFQGNLLYIFRSSSRIDSSSAPQTF